MSRLRTPRLSPQQARDPDALRRWIRHALALPIPLLVTGAVGCAASVEPGDRDASRSDVITTGDTPTPPPRPMCTSTDPLSVTRVVTPDADAGGVLGDGGLQCHVVCPSAAEVRPALPSLTYGVQSCARAPADGGGADLVECVYFSYACMGRRPEGYVSDAASAGPTSPGEYLAEACRLEAASVAAFERLARELAAHDAPRALVDAALRARDDERRHTRMIAALARRFGARPDALRADSAPIDAIRSLDELARENAREGCVGETFGALVGVVQSTRAADARVRRAMASIAHDEADHGALAWAVDGWARGRLTSSALARLDEHHAAALAALRASAATAIDPAVADPLGLPTPSDARALVAAVSAIA